MNDTNLHWADNLRAVATVAVILLHVSAGPVLTPYGELSAGDWWTGNLIDGTVRFCVPVFLMLTGALLLTKTYPIGEFLRKRLNRILLPFLFWSLLYIAYDLWVKWENHEYLDATEISTYTFRQLKTGASSHLWYIYMLIGIYLIFPVIGKWVTYSSRKEIGYYVIVWLSGILCGLRWLHEIQTNISLIYFSGFLGYTVLGYLLATMPPRKDIRLNAGLLFVAGTLITIVGTYIETSSDRVFYGELYGYLSPNVIMASAGIFLFFRHTSFQSNRFRQLTTFISRYSYGIYLSHVVFILLLGRIGIGWKMMTPAVSIPLTAGLCLFLSLLTTYVLSKIPVLKHVAG